MDAVTFATLATAFGVGSVLTIFAKAIVDRRQRKRQETQDGWAALDVERGKRDIESRARRKLEEFAHTTRRAWHVRHGTPYEEMPPWPRYNTAD